MKRIFTLLFGLSMAVLPLIAQEVDGSFVFVDENEEIIEDGSTIVRNTIVTDEGGMELINSGVSVKNISAAMSDYIRIIYTISQLDNGAFQICFPMNCNSQNEVGEYMTGSGPLMGTLQNIQSEWLPEADGSCVVSLQIEVLTKLGFTYIHKAYGSTITIEFVKGDIPGPEPVKGDVNGDGEVGIADVNSLIDMILNNIQPKEGDVNGDGEVGIADVNALIELILNPPPVNQTFTVNGVTFKMVKVEGGTFTMGATPEQGSDASEYEYPAHQVTLSSFSIGETEVTQALWQAVMDNNPSFFQIDDLNLPVEQVSWDDCQEFITKLNQMTGKQFRLPTEAEWEYAARGGKKSKGYKYSGSNDVDEVAWYWMNCGSITHAVGTKKANELGLYDMSGNVQEWCNDVWSNYTEEAQTNPTGPTTDGYRIARGGYWENSSPATCRVSYRASYLPGYRDYDRGLRLAL